MRQLSRYRLSDAEKSRIHPLNFYRRLGMNEIHRTEQDIFFVYPRARFDANKGAYRSILEQEEING